MRAILVLALLLLRVLLATVRPPGLRVDTPPPLAARLLLTVLFSTVSVPRFSMPPPLLSVARLLRMVAWLLVTERMPARVMVPALVTVKPSITV